MKLLDEQVTAMLARITDDIRSGELEVEGYRVEDTDALYLRLVCVAGPKVAARARAAAVEQTIADAGGDAAPGVAGSTVRGVWRAPGPTDACPSCGARGQMRDAGGMAWLCIACNSEAPITGG